MLATIRDTIRNLETRLISLRVRESALTEKLESKS